MRVFTPRALLLSFSFAAVASGCIVTCPPGEELPDDAGSTPDLALCAGRGFARPGEPGCGDGVTWDLSLGYAQALGVPCIQAITPAGQPLVYYAIAPGPCGCVCDPSFLVPPYDGGAIDLGVPNGHPGDAGPIDVGPPDAPVDFACGTD